MWWEKILTYEAKMFIMSVAEEDGKVLNEFFEYLKKTNYKDTIMLATIWHTLEDTKQANIAIKQVGWENASRYIVLMDYLSKMFKDGKLI